MRSICIASIMMLFSVVTFAQSSEKVPAGFVSLFNGTSFTNWKVPAGDNGHWKILDAIIDYDAESEAQDKNLWTEKEYKDFVLYVDWRIKETPWKNPNVKFQGLEVRNTASFD